MFGLDRSHCIMQQANLNSDLILCVKDPEHFQVSNQWNHSQLSAERVEGSALSVK